MIFGFFVLLVAVIISVISAFYSVLGLTSIFPGAFLPVVIMGTALELGKLTTAIWLHKNWKRANLQFKLYLVPAICMLVLLTSMGIFGGLSKAHLDQAVPTGNVAAQIELISTKIETQRENINASRKNLKQLDDAVDQVLARSTNEQGASRSAALRKNQAKDRANIQTEIETAQKSIATLNEEKNKVQQELRAVEAEVGPIKYIAQLIYGDNPDANLLERAVRWVIILIVIVFDPLAIVLLLAGDQQWQWAKAEQLARHKKKEEPVQDPELVKQLHEMVNKFQEENTELFDQIDSLSEKNADLSSQNSQLYKEYRLLEQELAKATAVVTYETPLVEPTPPELTAVPEEHDDSLLSKYDLDLGKFRRLRSVFAEADNVIKFGIEYPVNPLKGQMFISTSTVPTALYKFNGEKWIQTDKLLSDQYIYNDAYIEYLMDKIETGEYDPEMLTAAEQAQIESKLK